MQLRMTLKLRNSLFLCRPTIPVGGLLEHVPPHVPRVHGRSHGAGGAQAGVLRAVPAGDGAGSAP